jgi:S-formylglutathione hydrolase FrmB
LQSLIAVRICCEPQIVETFRTIELSDPSLERDGIRMVTVKSTALGRRADITLFGSPDCTGPLPLAILLHGVYGSHWSWAFCGAAHRTAQHLVARGQIRGMVIAMPSDGLWGDGSGYVRHTSGEDYERWIIDEVPAACQLAAPGRILPRGGIFLGGHSMGGYGALRLGAKYPDRVCAVSAHSAITHARQLGRFIEESPQEFGPLDDPKYDVFHWMQENKASLPKIRLDCGKRDDLLAENRLLHQRMTQAGIEHTYEEFPGGHNWEYWREHLRDTLLFFDKALDR